MYILSLSEGRGYMQKIIIVIPIILIALCSYSNSRSSSPNDIDTGTPAQTIEPSTETTIKPTPDLPYHDFTNMQLSVVAWRSYFEQGYNDIEYELKMVDGGYYSIR